MGYVHDFNDMPAVCIHKPVMWYDDRDGASILKPRRPRDTYSLTQKVHTSHGVRFVAPWGNKAPSVSEALAAYPELLNRYIVTKIEQGVLSQPKLVEKTSRGAAAAQPQEPAWR